MGRRKKIDAEFDAKIERAKTLLRLGGLSINDIARSCGLAWNTVNNLDKLPKEEEQRKTKNITEAGFKDPLAACCQMQRELENAAEQVYEKYGIAKERVHDLDFFIFDEDKLYDLIREEWKKHA